MVRTWVTNCYPFHTSGTLKEVLLQLYFDKKTYCCGVENTVWNQGLILHLWGPRIPQVQLAQHSLGDLAKKEHLDRASRPCANARFTRESVSHVDLPLLDCSRTLHLGKVEIKFKEVKTLAGYVQSKCETLPPTPLGRVTSCMGTGGRRSWTCRAWIRKPGTSHEHRPWFAPK